MLQTPCTFLEDNFPDIKLASELEKEILISAFGNSSSFDETHRIVAKLRYFTDFTNDQLNHLVESAIYNNQIFWIIKDPDVNQFINNIIAEREDDVRGENLKRLYDRMEIGEDNENYYDDMTF